MKNQGIESLLGSFIIVRRGGDVKSCIIDQKQTFDTFCDFKSIFYKPETIFQFYNSKYLGISETMRKKHMLTKLAKYKKKVHKSVFF